MGGEGGDLRAGAGRAPQRDEADRARRGGRAARLAGRARRAREAALSGDRHRPGRSGQVAPDARAHRHDRLLQGPSDHPPRPVPAVRRHLLPRPGRGAAGRVRSARHRRPRDLLAQDPERRREPDGGAGRARGGRAQRGPAGGPAGHRAPGAERLHRRRPPAHARGPVLGRTGRDRGDHPPPHPGAGDRRHPLGRRGDARPDRPPGPLGARPAAARLPHARRAAGAPARVERRAKERDLDLAGAADRGGDPRAGRGADAGLRERGRRDRAPGSGALGRQPVVRGGDGEPPDRGGHRRDVDPAGHGAVAAGGQARLPGPARAQAAASGLGRGPDVLGRLAGADRGRGGTGPERARWRRWRTRTWW